MPYWGGSASRLEPLADTGRSVRLVALANVTRYSHTMSKTEKLLVKARRQPAGLSFDEFKALLVRCEWVFDHQTGSHEIWYSLGRYRLPIQSAGGKAKGYQVKQFLKVLEEEESDG
jgi:hypothetical protein